MYIYYTNVNKKKCIKIVWQRRMKKNFQTMYGDKLNISEKSIYQYTLVLTMNLEMYPRRLVQMVVVRFKFVYKIKFLKRQKIPIK